MRVSLVFYFFALGIALALDGSERHIQPGGDPGRYTVKQWKTDWPGCEWENGIEQGRLSIVQRGETKAFRVEYAIGQIGPDKGGAGWRFPIGRCEEAQLGYTVRFGKDFDWVKGGKLPGLCGGPENVSGGRPANGANGFSARLMWRADGRGEAYVYHKNQRASYGDSFPFPAAFHYPTDTEIQVRMRVRMNTPGSRNGALQIWIATNGPASEQRVVDRADMEWRTGETFGVDGLYFDTFHGGNDATWAPTRASWTEFSQIVVTKQP
jgi:hypothetical protein